MFFNIFALYDSERYTTCCEMSTAIKRKTYAKLFFAIFFVKMLISATPIFFHNFDRDALLQVVLQLEIENNNGKSGLGDQAKDIFTKYYTKDVTFLYSALPSHYLKHTNFIADEERHIQAFYPSVPTPPPNS